MSVEQMEYITKQMIVWYENKLAIADTLEEKTYYSIKIETIKEMQDKLF